MADVAAKAASAHFAVPGLLIVAVVAVVVMLVVASNRKG
jgi:hypothetical protein